jgi:hypothetical protein
MDVQSQFHDHEVVRQAPNDYVEMSLAPDKIMVAWSTSLYSYELLNKDGSIKRTDEMVDETLQRYVDAEEKLKRGEAVPKPIIGIGIMEGIEIGIGRELVAAAKALGVHEMPVHVRKAQADEIKSYF